MKATEKYSVFIETNDKAEFSIGKSWLVSWIEGRPLWKEYPKGCNSKIEFKNKELAQSVADQINLLYNDTEFVDCVSVEPTYQ